MLRIRVLGLDLFGCREALARLDDFIDRELNARETRQVALHLKICRSCAAEFAGEETLQNALRSKMQRLDAPESLKRSVAQALQQHAQEHSTETRAADEPIVSVDATSSPNRRE